LSINNFVPLIVVCNFRLCGADTTDSASNLIVVIENFICWIYTPYTPNVTLTSLCQAYNHDLERLQMVPKEIYSLR